MNHHGCIGCDGQVKSTATPRENIRRLLVGNAGSLGRLYATLAPRTDIAQRASPGPFIGEVWMPRALDIAPDMARMEGG